MSNHSERPQLATGIYRHNKSAKHYEVIGLALETQYEQDWLVVYKPLYDSDIELFVRSYDDFIALVDINGKKMPRFEPVDMPRTFLA